MRAAFNAQAFPAFEDGCAETQSLQGTALTMSHELENSDSGAQSGSGEVQREVGGVAIPYGNSGGADQHPCVIRERKSKGERGSLSGIFENPQGQRWAIAVA